MIYGLNEKEGTIMKAIIVISLIIAFVLWCCVKVGDD